MDGVCLMRGDARDGRFAGFDSNAGLSNARRRALGGVRSEVAASSRAAEAAGFARCGRAGFRHVCCAGFAVVLRGARGLQFCWVGGVCAPGSVGFGHFGGAAWAGGVCEPAVSPARPSAAGYVLARGFALVGF